MKIKLILFFALAVLAISSCKENEEETINPATEKILADGLNIGPDGVDTVVVFLKDSGLGVDINYSSGSGKWCSATECTDSVSGADGIRIQCAPSDTSLFSREALVNISSLRGNYIIKVNQDPYKLAYFKDSIVYVKNTGGSFVVPVKANTSFTINKTMFVTGSGDNTKPVDTSWMGSIYKVVTCNEGQTFEFPFIAQLNTGLGRRAFLDISGDSFHNKKSIVEVRQEPRTLNASETIEFGMFSERLNVLLGKEEENLTRLRSLSLVGFAAPQDVEYAAKISRLSLDTLTMSACDFSSYDQECNIDSRLFFGSHLSSISLPKGIKTINYEAFADCKNLKTVVLPASVERIGNEAFACSSKIEEIVIPTDSKLRYIGDEAFNTGGTMNRLFIPNTAYLSSNALKGLRVNNLHIALATPPILNPDTEADRSKSTLYVPKGSKEKYMSAIYWKNFGKIVEE